MTTLEEIRKKKLEEMMRAQQEKAQEQAQIQQQIGQIESVIKQFLTKEALARYGNLKAAHPEKAIQAAVILIQAIQKGQVKGKIDDVLFKKLLAQMEPPKKEFNIKRA